jgi:hypothetical protein
MNEIDLWLERLFWIAMISVPFLAIWAVPHCFAPGPNGIATD